MVGSVIPLINTELLVVTLAATTPAYAIWPLIVLATAGTMVGKAFLFFVGRGAVRFKIRGRDKVDAFLGDMEKRQGLTGSLLFVSAVTGFPPFYVVTVASGAAGLALSRFLIVGFVGRFVRYAVLVVAPHLVKEIF